MKYKGSPRKVKSVFIHHPLQREFMMLMVIILMVSTLFIGIVIHLTVQESLEEGMLPTAGRTLAFDFIQDVHQKLLVRVFAVLFVTVIAAIISGVVFLHRVAGPIYRIRLTLKHLAENKIPAKNVKLRHGDFFQEVAVELNKVVEKMRSEHPEHIVNTYATASRAEIAKKSSETPPTSS